MLDTTIVKQSLSPPPTLTGEAMVGSSPQLPPINSVLLQTDEHAVLIFALLLFIILVTPYLFKKIKVPHIIGLILFGWLIGGKHPFTLIEKSSIDLYSKVGVLFIMFIAGLDIDMVDFKKNSHKSIIFGLMTFLVPMTLGVLSSKFILGFAIMPAVLLASFYASHTLLTYPIISKYGIAKNKAVNIAVGGTMITDVLALLVLAIVVAMFTKGEATLNSDFWVLMVLKLIAFTFIVVWAFPKITRAFLKYESNNISQYLFILSMVFVAGYLAELAGVEAIIGAFLAGIALNPMIPETSPLRNRIEFIGNALFIPIFLMGVGMLINVGDFFTSWNVIFIALVMTIVATISKFSAAFIAQKTFQFNKNEMFLLFGLSNSQAAATLAAVMVAQRVGIFGDDINAVLNGTILMILATCTIASFATEKGASVIAENEAETTEDTEPDCIERILIPLSHPDTLDDLMQLGLTIKDKKYKNNIYAVNIISSNNSDDAQEKKSKALLERAAKITAATDQTLQQILRYDLNISNGIYNVVKEHKISDIIIGLHQKSGLIDTFLGQLTDGILANCVANTYIYHSVQPMNTINRMIVVIPKYADTEAGFSDFVKKLWNIAQNNSTKLIVYASQSVIEILLLKKETQPIDLELIKFTDWDDFLIISSKLDPNSGLVIFMSRPGGISRNAGMNNISRYLNKYFLNHNYILYYPMQNR